MRVIIVAAVFLCCGWVQADELVFTVGQQLSPYTIPGTDPAHFTYLRSTVGSDSGGSHTKISTSENAFVGWGFELAPVDDLRFYITDQFWTAESSAAAAALLASISNNPNASLFVEAPTIESTIFFNPLDPTACSMMVCTSYNQNDFNQTVDTSGWNMTSIYARLDLTSRNRLVSWNFSFYGQAIPEPASWWMVASICGVLMTCGRTRLS
ncbi:MAG: hypothetical protein AB7G28_06360 [Pirellulales bacterium]